MRRLIALFALSIWLAAPAAAQTPVPGLGNLNFDGDIGDVIDYYNNRLSNGVDRSNMRNAVVAQRHAIRDELTWSGQRGYLIEHRVQVAAGGGAQLVRRPFGPPVFHGVGSSPADAYAASPLRVGLAAPESPWRLEPGLSFFIWVEPQKNWLGQVKLRPAEIPPGEAFADAVRRDGLAMIADAGAGSPTTRDTGRAQSCGNWVQGEKNGSGRCVTLSLAQMIGEQP